MVGPAFTMRFIPAREDKTATGRRAGAAASNGGMPARPCVGRRCPRRPARGLGGRYLLRPPEGARLRRHRDRWRAARHRGRLQDRLAGLSPPPVLTAEWDRPSAGRPQPADRLRRCGGLSGRHHRRRLRRGGRDPAGHRRRASPKKRWRPPSTTNSPRQRWRAAARWSVSSRERAKRPSATSRRGRTDGAWASRRQRQTRRSQGRCFRRQASLCGGPDETPHRGTF